jgi:hypothetical protein
MCVELRNRIATLDPQQRMRAPPTYATKYPVLAYSEAPVVVAFSRGKHELKGALYATPFLHSPTPLSPKNGVIGQKVCMERISQKRT